MNPLRLSYNRVEAEQTIASELAYLPLALSTTNAEIEVQGLLDTGSTVNVLPYDIGIALGFLWDQQNISVALTGSLSNAPACGVIVNAQVTSFPPVELVFAWTKIADIPVILGQVNFFMEFDICFFRSQAAFEIKPKVI